MKFFFIVLCFLNSSVLLLGQQISGSVFEMNNDIPVEFVNIGIVGKNIGTVSDQNGNYTLQFDPEYHNDTLMFSCIGYHSYSIKVSDFVNLNNGNVKLEKRLYDITEIVVRPKKVKQKTFGITKSGGIVVGCFNPDSSLVGREVGVLMKNKNRVFLKEVNLNFSTCTADTVFYRINIYKAYKEKQFENILTDPIYVNMLKKEIKDKITINLRHLNISVEGDFLVSLEMVKDLGTGRLNFPMSFRQKSYFRVTSQGTWITVPAAPSISVLVDVEI